MKAIKTIVSLQHTPKKHINRPIGEFFTVEEPSKGYIKKKIEEDFGITLEIRKCSPDEGGDFGAFFYHGDFYITYSFADILIDEIK